MIRSIEQLDLSREYSYADYLTWRFDERVELIRGKVYRMGPAPDTSDQASAGELLRQISRYLQGRPGGIFVAPFDVRLPLPPDRRQDDRIKTVVQPDISVVCDPTLLDDRGCLGPPDWIIEILSRQTAHKDLHEKFEVYAQAGVLAYWVVHPGAGTVLPYRLNEQGMYQLLRQRPFVTGEKIPAGIFSGLEVDLGLVFG